MTMVMAIESNGENWKSHCQCKWVFAQKKSFPHRSGIKFYGICNTCANTHIKLGWWNCIQNEHCNVLMLKYLCQPTASSKYDKRGKFWLGQSWPKITCAVSVHSLTFGIILMKMMYGQTQILFCPRQPVGIMKYRLFLDLIQKWGPLKIFNSLQSL